MMRIVQLANFHGLGVLALRNRAGMDSPQPGFGLRHPFW